MAVATAPKATVKTAPKTAPKTAAKAAPKVAPKTKAPAKVAAKPVAKAPAKAKVVAPKAAPKVDEQIVILPKVHADKMPKKRTSGQNTGIIKSSQVLADKYKGKKPVVGEVATFALGIHRVAGVIVDVSAGGKKLIWQKAIIEDGTLKVFPLNPLYVFTKRISGLWVLQGMPKEHNGQMIFGLESEYIEEDESLADEYDQFCEENKSYPEPLSQLATEDDLWFMYHDMLANGHKVAAEIVTEIEDWAIGCGIDINEKVEIKRDESGWKYAVVNGVTLDNGISGFDNVANPEQDVEEKAPVKVAKKAPVKVVKPVAKTAKPAPKTAAKPVTKTAAKSAPKPVTKATAKPATKATAKPATKATAKPATKATAKPATKATAKPATKATAKPVTKAQAKKAVETIELF